MVNNPGDVRPPDHKAGGELHHNEKPTIVIDNKQYQAPARTMTGEQLRRLAEPDIGPNYDLWQEVPGGEDNLVHDNEHVKLHDCMGFYSSSCEINPG